MLAELSDELSLLEDPARIAEFTASLSLSEFGAEVCAFVCHLGETGMMTREVSQLGARDYISVADTERFQAWLEVADKRAFTISGSDLFLTESGHDLEYIVPLAINGRIKGVFIAGFEQPCNLTVKLKRKLELAAGLAALNISLRVKNQRAIDASADRAREEQRKFTGAILDTLPVSLYVIDREYKIVAWNRHREVGDQGVPRGVALGSDVFEILSRQPREKMRQEFERAFRTGKIERIEQRTADENGATKHWLISKIPMRDEESGEITHVITVGEDISMRVEAIHAVNRAEKLAAIGRLAAGVVHEINNPLATIAACSESLECRIDEDFIQKFKDGEDFKEYLALIRSETFRCKSITENLLNFSRVKSGNWSTVDVNSVIQSSVRLLEHQKRGSDIQTCLECEEALPLYNGDEGKLQQAIIALATNAIDAMGEGGVLTFRTYSRAKQIVVEVQDTGHGIPTEDLPRIFEPFFTTKEVGKGTGLGLAVCYGIVTEHNGKMSVRSTPGRGTTFSMYLPLNQKESQEQAA